MKYSEPSPCSDRCLGVRICVSVNPQTRVKRALVVRNTHPREGLAADRDPLERGANFASGDVRQRLPRIGYLQAS
jgi:hypothetical protein